MTGTAPSPRGWTDTWKAPALVAVLAVLAFSGSLANGFAWDDHRFIHENPSVVHPTSWMRFLTDAGTVDNLGAYGLVRPMRTIEFAADYALFGDAPFWFHVHSLLWHAAAAAALCALLRRLIGHGGAAVTASLFWALNPVQAECVAFISSRGDVAMCACSFASVLFALKSKGLDRALAASLALALLAMAYKETGAVLCCVMTVFVIVRRVRPWALLHWAVAAAFAVYWLLVSTHGLTHGATFAMGGSRAATIATMCRGVGWYGVEALLPVQSLDWHMTPSTSFADAASLAWLAVHLALVASAVATWRRAPLWTISVFWFYGFLAPTSNVIVSLALPTAERFLVPAMAGVALAVGCALLRAPRAARVGALVACAALGALTVLRVPMWRSDASLWETVLADHESPRGRNFEAQTLRDRALALRDEAAKMPQGEARAAALARVKALLEESLSHSHKALELRYEFEMQRRSPTHLTRYSELLASNVCHVLLREEEALWHAEEGIRIDATVDGDAEFDRAMPLFALGYAPQGLGALRRFWALRGAMPDAETAKYALAAADICEQGGLLATAEEGYQFAAACFPEGPRRDDARRRYEAVRAKPRAPEAAALERDRIRQMDESLAKLPRSCPVVRYPE